jgi:SAM-dependent methyltransferase
MLRRLWFPGSKAYWESRYAGGGSSGGGSQGRLAEFRAEVLNSFVQNRGIESVVELGCGDGYQLSLASYTSYIGLDVSPTAVDLCRKRFAGDDTKTFHLYDPMLLDELRYRIEADLALSLDVIYHLTEDDVFELYMRTLFAVARKFVIIYSSDTDENEANRPPHFKNRRFSTWVKTNCPNWELVRRIPNKYPFEGDDHTGSISDFFVYERTERGSALA